MPSASSGPGRARPGRLLVVAVAWAEALAAAAAGIASAASGIRGGSLVLALGVAVVSAGLAYLLVEVARALGRGRRWPVGIFVTVQLLTGLVALSVGTPSLTTPATAPVVAGATVAALLLAATGLVGVAMQGSRGDRSAGPAGQD